MLREARPLLFVVLFGAVLWLAWLVVRPFVPGTVWAAVLVVAFRPLHERLTRAFRGRAWAASATVTVVVAAFVVVPIVIAAVQVVQGSIQGYQWVQTAYHEQAAGLGAEGRWPWLDDAAERGKELVGLANVDVQAAALSGVKKLGTFVAAKAPAFVGGAFGLVFSFFVMLVMTVVLFAGGPGFARAVAAALPLPRADADRVLEKLGQMTRSVFISVGLTALTQAALGGLMLLILGVDNAFTLAAAMFFCSVLPAGTAIVWLPVAIWLASTGHPWKAVILFAWGAGVISTIDNVLRPLFARSDVEFPTILLVAGMVGGLFAFGLVGVFLGPIVLYVLREMLDVLRREAYGERAGGA